MNQIYTLSSDELAQFHDDDFRSALRTRLFDDLSPGDSIEIQSEEGELWDRLSRPAEGEEEATEATPLLTPEELEEKRLTDEALTAEAMRFEHVIKPLVITELRSQVREEFRDQLRDKTNEVLQLRASVAAQKLIDARNENRISASISPLKLEIARLKSQNEALRSQNEAWEKRHSADMKRLQNDRQPEGNTP